MKTFAATLLSAVLFAAPLSAQIEFWASGDGLQNVPPNAATLGGSWGKFVLNTGTSQLSYDVHAWGFATATTGAHLHFGPVGINGGIEVPLIGGGPDWAGASPPLTAAQIGDLRAGDWYLNVHTNGTPGGEVRGQVRVQPNEFGARLDQAQVTPPPAPTGATANATMTLNQNGTLTYSVVASGLSGPLTAAHIHNGAFGATGGIDISLIVTGPSTASGTTPPMSIGPKNRLQLGNSYVNLHTALNPGGEIRGQIVRSGIPYGPPSDPGTGAIKMYTTGAPTNLGGGGLFTFHIEQGLPFGSGLLLGSFFPEHTSLNFEPLLVDAGFLFLNVSLPLNAAGELHLPVVTPPFPSSATLYLQFFGLDSTAPNGKFNVSNGLEFPLTKLP
jgi:hypothetical protein